MNKLLVVALVPVVLFLFCFRFYPNPIVYTLMLVDFHTSWKIFDSPMYERYHQYLISTLSEREEGKIPELFASDNFTKEDVVRLSKGFTFPLIIRGLLENATGVQQWNDRQFWLDNYGQEQILCGTLEAVRPFCTIKDFFDEVDAGKPFYVSGASKIFTKHPELTQMVETDRIKMLEPGSRMSTQVFMGLPGMGSDIHCAVGVNIFRMMAGSKKWWFIPPSQTAYLKPSFNVNGFSSHTHTKVGKNGEEMSPWMNKLERYVATLHPGDVLINPPFFWHGILNLGQPGDLVIGVPTRYGKGDSTPAAMKSNLFFNLVTVLTILKQYGSLQKYFSVVDEGGDLLEDKIEANRRARMKN